LTKKEKMIKRRTDIKRGKIKRGKKKKRLKDQKIKRGTEIKGKRD
jgi:hypothetical protein